MLIVQTYPEHFWLLKTIYSNLNLKCSVKIKTPHFYDFKKTNIFDVGVDNLEFQVKINSI